MGVRPYKVIYYEPVGIDYDKRVGLRESLTRKGYAGTAPALRKIPNTFCWLIDADRLDGIMRYTNDDDLEKIRPFHNKLKLKEYINNL